MADNNRMKILNLYACLGGNRYKWDEVTDIEVTAVELDPEAARLYQERFPNDKVIVADAHQYLLDHYKEFDFIWSSPPCPSHSSFQHSMKNKRKMKYPDMKLYEEIIFLKHFVKGKYVVENVIGYYDPLVKPQECNRHWFWCNFPISSIDLPSQQINQIKKSDTLFGRNIEKYEKVDTGSGMTQTPSGPTFFKSIYVFFYQTNIQKSVQNPVTKIIMGLL